MANSTPAVAAAREQDAFIKAEQQLRVAKDRCDVALKSLQDACRHERVYEVDYDPQGYGQMAAPKRVCAICGWAERGWHCGYGRLAVPDAQVSQHCTSENFDRLRRGEVHQWTPRGGR
jgi:hypothetical protein